MGNHPGAIWLYARPPSFDDHYDSIGRMLKMPCYRGDGTIIASHQDIIFLRKIVCNLWLNFINQYGRITLDNT